MAFQNTDAAAFTVNPDIKIGDKYTVGGTEYTYGATAPLPAARPDSLDQDPSAAASSGGGDNDRYREAKTLGDIKDMIAGYAHKAQAEFFGSKQSHPGNPSDTLAEIMGATLAKLKNGQRQPMNKTARNPMEEESTAMAMKYFGQGPTHKISIDNVFPKIIGVFSAEQGGAGASSFNFSNLPSFGGSMQLVDVIAKVVTGGGVLSADSGMIPSVLAMADQVKSIVGGGVDLHTMVDMSRPDHMIPMMNAMSSAFGAQDTPDLFGEDIFQQGYLLAGDVQGHLASLVGGSASYSKILDTVASGKIDASVDALSYLAGHSTTVADTIAQVRSLQSGAGIPSIAQTLSNIQVPSPVQVANMADALQSVMHLNPLEGTQTIINQVLPQLSNVSNIISQIGSVGSVGQLQNVASQLGNFSGALGQLSSLGGTLSSLGDFSKLSADVSSLGSLPQALDGAINSLNMSPQDMAQSLLSSKANEQLQILGHIVKEAGKF